MSNPKLKNITMTLVFNQLKKFIPTQPFTYMQVLLQTGYSQTGNPIDAIFQTVTTINAQQYQIPNSTQNHQIFQKLNQPKRLNVIQDLFQTQLKNTSVTIQDLNIYEFDCQKINNNQIQISINFRFHLTEKNKNNYFFHNFYRDDVLTPDQMAVHQSIMMEKAFKPLDQETPKMQRRIIQNDARKLYSNLFKNTKLKTTHAYILDALINKNIHDQFFQN